MGPLEARFLIAPVWGGRFSKEPASELSAFADSLPFDRILWSEDIEATRVHAADLARAGVITGDELAQIKGALDEAAKVFADNAFEFTASDEDIHGAVERFLTDRLGDTGAKIHAGRSRNDLVVTDLRLWLKPRIARIARGIYDLQQALYRLAREHDSTIAPGYTHLQRAQPILLAHHFLAHAFALARDFERTIAAYRRADVSTLGAAAFAGTSLPLDAKSVANELRFSRVFDNAADAVSARDFILEFLAASAILAVTVSRLAEEIVLWTTAEFSFAALDDSYATGSSIMPQKKNPDVAELARGRTARVIGNLTQMLSLMKGLPLTYNRDLQEDKVPVFETAEIMLGVLGVMRGALQTMEFDKTRLEEAASGGGTMATDLAERLVLAGTPFRTAHEAVGKLVLIAAQRGIPLTEVDEQELAGVHPGISLEMLKDLTVRSSIASRTSHGGTAPERVAEQIQRLENILDDEERWIAGFVT